MGENIDDILLRLSLDPSYIESAKKSICKDCFHVLPFNGEYYDCKMANHVLVEYLREGLFHTEIIKCTQYSKEEPK